MRTTVHKTPQQLGELIVAAYDEEVYSTDPRERLRLRRAVLHMLRRMRKPPRTHQSDCRLLHQSDCRLLMDVVHDDPSTSRSCGREAYGSSRDAPR
jgi:hypothetical protein